MEKNKNICIIGGGNIGTAIYNGFSGTGKIPSSKFTITRRRKDYLSEFIDRGVNVTSDNAQAVKNSEIILLTVLPKQLPAIIDEIKENLDQSKIIVSVVTAYSIQEIKDMIGKEIPVILCMPNTAIAVSESMTCLAAMDKDKDQLDEVISYFELVGEVLKIPERLIPSATILASCGVAFFMRYIRAASQGGIQVGFHAEEAQLIATQTARGASKLLLSLGNHPETEIDKVTTPMGCTITGLNEMEHNGLSSALIKGLVASYNEIKKLK